MKVLSWVLARLKRSCALMMSAHDPTLWAVHAQACCSSSRAAGSRSWPRIGGDGLATDPAVIAAMGLSDPNPFFTALLQKPYLSQARAMPHKAACADIPRTCLLHMS